MVQHQKIKWTTNHCSDDRALDTDMSVKGAVLSPALLGNTSTKVTNQTKQGGKFLHGGAKQYTANPRITRLIRSEKSSRNTKTRKVNN